MNSKKTGDLIRRLRTDEGMTQKQLADRLRVSDRAVSKWERGVGSPDVSLLGVLSAELGVDVQNLLSGNLDLRDTDGGNMKRMKFYRCTHLATYSQVQRMQVCRAVAEFSHHLMCNARKPYMKLRLKRSRMNILFRSIIP